MAQQAATTPVARTDANGMVVIQDATTMTNKIYLTYNEADITAQLKNEEYVPVYERETILHFVKGKQQTKDWSITMNVVEMVGAGSVTNFEDFMLPKVMFDPDVTGVSSANATYNDGPNELDIFIYIEDPAQTAGTPPTPATPNEQIKLTGAVCTTMSVDPGYPKTVTMSGVCRSSTLTYNS